MNARPILFFAVVSILSHSLGAAPEAFEVGKDRFGEMPRGKEADGIVGDFVLRNDLVEAVISQNAPHRKANMGTFWGAANTTPGCLYDLSLRGENNDQITIFSPLGQKGEVSYVRVVDGSPAGEASIETVVTAAKGNGISHRHVYTLRDGMQGVLVTSTVTNETAVAYTFKGKDNWTNFTSKGTIGRYHWADSVDPADKVGYAYASEPGSTTLKDNIIAPGASFTRARFLAIGRSPAEAVGLLLARHGETGTINGELKAADETPVTTGSVTVQLEGKPLKIYPDEKGMFSVKVRPGTHEFTAADIGRDSVVGKFDATVGGESKLDVTMSKATTVEFEVTLQDGSDTPCKVQFLGKEPTKNPNLGPQNRAHGCNHQYHSETGRFSVAIPPGSYSVIVTRGIEFGHARHDLEIKPGETQKIATKLVRQVATPGWVSSDFHNHSTPSGDNTCGTDDRLINLAAEHIEFAPTTEHNRLFDWTPNLKRLGLDDEIATVPGMELTGSGAHINAFPFAPDPTKQDGGAPQWSKDPRLTALTLRNHQGADTDRWIHLNHPDMAENFVDKNGDGRVDGGYVNLGKMLDGLETQNGNYQNILNTSPYIISKQIGPKGRVSHCREFIWLQLLNQGHRIWAIAVADAHSVYGNGVGGWRTYVKSSTDDPAKIDWREMSRSAKAGRMVLSNGPYLEVEAGDGTLPGGEMRSTGDLKLKVKVQCPDWIEIDRVQILVNGRQRKDLNFTKKTHPEMFVPRAHSLEEALDGTRGGKNKELSPKHSEPVRFDQTLDIPLSQDSHIIAVAYGHDSDLTLGYGTSPQSKMRPCAYNNPIFVDVDGGGFSPNRDTLGYGLPVKGKTVDQIRELLKD